MKHCSTQKFKKSFQGFGELFERPITVYSDNTQHFLKANKLQALKNVQLTNSATKLSGETVE